MNRHYYHLCGAAVVLLVCGSTANAAVEIDLRERIAMNGSVVRLGDVAEIVAADRERGRQLAALPLMPAPAPGTERFLQKREIEDLLSAHGIELQELRFDGAARVAITASGGGWRNREGASGEVLGGPMNRHAAILEGKATDHDQLTLDQTRAKELGDEFRQIIVSYLNATTGQSGMWRVTCDVADRHLALLDGATPQPVCQGGSAPWTGRQRFIVSFRTAQGAVQVPVYADVTATMVPVVVAVQPIARGDVFTAAHVELRSVDYVPKATDRRAALDAVETLVGMEARQAIQAGDVVFTDQVQSPVLVRRGDFVTVSSNGGGIRVRTTARARQDGAQGELVQVESLETRERFDARVVGLRETAVFALTRPTAAEPPERIDTARR